MRFAPVLAFLAAMAAAASGAARADADELAAARAALRGGDSVGAALAVDRYLALKPKDPQGRFLKGVILSDQGRTNEAFDVFFALTRDHPEFAAPYNNLAVIYAARGEYERARGMLESAIRADPGYATAYENLGDVLARLANQAYEKAAKLDAANPGAQAKLSLARDLVDLASRPRPADAAAALRRN